MKVEIFISLFEVAIDSHPFGKNMVVRFFSCKDEAKRTDPGFPRFAPSLFKLLTYLTREIRRTEKVSCSNVVGEFTNGRKRFQGIHKDL